MRNHHPEPVAASLEVLEEENKQFRNQPAKLVYHRWSNTLRIRGKLPDDLGTTRRDTQISTGFPLDLGGIVAAAQMCRKVNSEVNGETFIRKSYRKKRGCPTKLLDVALTRFTRAYLRKDGRNAYSRFSSLRVITGFSQRLREVHRKTGLELGVHLLVETMKTYPRNTASSRNCGAYLKQLAKQENIKIPDELWDRVKSTYSNRIVEKKDIPTDEVIVENWKMLRGKNQRWANVYALMAAYGLRNCEVFFLDLGGLEAGESDIVKVLKGKTGPRSMRPLPVDWACSLALMGKRIELPRVVTDRPLQRIGAYVSKQFKYYEIPFTPYILRHAYAVRSIGKVDLRIITKAMGHSIETHTKVYHNFLNETHLMENWADGPLS